MAIVPLKQTILIRKASGELDDWGRPIESEPIEAKARVEEVTEVIRNIKGDEVVVGVRVILDKIADLGYDDEIEFTNEIGVTVARNPEKIEVKRHLSGKPILTVVYI